MWTLEGVSEAATLYARAARETRVVVVQSSFMVGGWLGVGGRYEELVPIDE
jgi:hypothetical protein